MKKVFLAVVMSAFVLASVGCNQNISSQGGNISANSDSIAQGNTNDVDNYTDDESGNITETNNEATEETVPEDETDPVSKSAEIPTQSQQGTVDIADISGMWLPQRAESAASGAEVSMTEAFGSVYSTYGGSLNISGDGSFTLNMGVYSYNGNITPSDNGLQVQYDDNSTDIYDYIVYDQDDYKEIKARVNDYFVYFG